MRIDKDNYYLNIAEVVASRSTCLRRKYGAVIVNNDEIIATGYNGAPRGEPNCCDVGECYCRSHENPIVAEAAKHGAQYGSCVAVHAEQNAIISASRSEMLGATMYLYGEQLEYFPYCPPGTKLETAVHPVWTQLTAPEPCPICRRMIANAGIIRVVTPDKCSDDE